MAEQIIGSEEALDDLFGTTCKSCGREKPMGMAHCRKCFFSLPRPMRSALYREIGAGYEEAYTASLAHLRNGQGVRRG